MGPGRSRTDGSRAGGLRTAGSSQSRASQKRDPARQQQRGSSLATALADEELASARSAAQRPSVCARDDSDRAMRLAHQRQDLCV